MSKTVESAEQKDNDIDGITELYSRRRFGCCLFHFEDENVKAEYITFALETMRPTRLFSRVALPLCVALFWISFSFRMTVPSIPTTILLLISLLCGAGAFTLTFIETTLPILDALLQYLSALLALVGFALTPESVPGSDVTWVLPFGIGVLVVTTFNLSWLTRSATFVIFPAIAVVFSFDSVQFSSNFLFSCLVVLFTAMLCVVQEKLLRQEFLERRVAQHYAHQKDVAIQQQESLMESIVPRFVIPDLMLWIDSGFDPTKAVAHNYPETIVAFVRFDLSSSSSTPGSEVVPYAQRMLELHRSVDLTIDQFKNGNLGEDQPQVDKVKTMGDTIMLAGPFATSPVTDANSEEEKKPEPTTTAQAAPKAAALHAIAVSTELQRAVRHEVRCGIHMGDVVGAVLGTDRLCFDIFGDAVNTASRVMTGVDAGEVGISDAVVSRCLEDDDSAVSKVLNYSQGDVQRQFQLNSKPKELTAKGKGNLLVWTLRRSSGNGGSTSGDTPNILTASTEEGTTVEEEESPQPNVVPAEEL